MSSSAFSLTGSSRRRPRGTRGEPVIGGLTPDLHHFFCAHCHDLDVHASRRIPHIVNVRPTLLDDQCVVYAVHGDLTKTKLPWATTGAVKSFDEFLRWRNSAGC